MDAVLIGKFISENRKKLNMTQAELASKLNVTSQAVSKWENGRGIPDIEMLNSLSDIFQVDIKDILVGGKRKKNKKRKLYIYILIVLVVILIILIFLKVSQSHNSFNFYPLASDNDAFTIKGVIAYNKSKKSIYISEVNYSLVDEEKYKAMECILYEGIDNVEKKIGQWGELIQNGKDTYLLTELLKGIEFNIDNYDCSCESKNCNNLYLRINVLNKDNKIISYNIPLQIDKTCEVN